MNFFHFHLPLHLFAGACTRVCYCTFFCLEFTGLMNFKVDLDVLMLHLDGQRQGHASFVP